jgi:hypothetical protein
MWSDLQALDLGAIQSIAAVKKASLDSRRELLQVLFLDFPAHKK